MHTLEVQRSVKLMSLSPSYSADYPFVVPNPVSAITET